MLHLIQPYISLIVILLIGVGVLIFTTLFNSKFVELTHDWNDDLIFAFKVFGYILLIFYLVALGYAIYNVVEIIV